MVHFVLSSINASAKENGLQSIELLRHLVLVNNVRHFPDFSTFLSFLVYDPAIQEWTAENGLVTPTLKLKRSELRKKYENEIEQMFASETLL